MEGGTHSEQQSINWAEKYIEKLSNDMDSIKQDIRELKERIDANNKHSQNLVIAMIIGICAITIAFITSK